MKHSTILTLFFTFLIGFSLAGCSSSDDGSSSEGNGGDGNEQGIVPTNIEATVEIQGQDADNPHGDGSGIFSGTVTATDAVSYGFKVGSGTETKNTTGIFTYTVNSSVLLASISALHSLKTQCHSTLVLQDPLCNEIYDNRPR